MIDRIRKLHRLNEEGNVALEAVILAPVLLLVMLLLIACGRVALAQQAVVGAADAAARDASLQTNSTTARNTAVQSANAALTQNGLSCITTKVDVNAGGLNTPVGTTGAYITANISCTVNLSDITLPGLPGSKTLTANARSVIDPYRQR